MNILDGGVIEVLAPDERAQFFKKRGAGHKVARAHARLDHRGAFPVLPHAFVIEERRFGRQGDLRRSGVGTQTQVCAKDITVTGRLA